VTILVRAGALLLLLLAALPVARVAGDAYPSATAWPATVLVPAVGAVLLAVACALVLGGRVERAWRAVADAIATLPAWGFACLVIAQAIAGAAAIAAYCFSRGYISVDEVATAWHARMLLAGHVAIPADPNPEFFAVSEVMTVGRSYSQFPIGGPVLAALGTVLGTPWLIGPVAAGAIVWATWAFARRAYGERVGRGAALLAVYCPFLLLLSGTRLNHAPTAALAMSAAAALAAWDGAGDRRSLVRRAAAIGVCVGLMVAFRPLDAIVAATAIGGFQIIAAWRATATGRRDRIASLGVQLAAGLVPVAITLWANAATTGEPLLFGYEALHGAGHLPGFRVDATGGQFGVVDAVARASIYVLRLNTALFYWPIPSVVVIALVVLALRHATRWDAFLVAWILLQLAAYGAYWFDGDVFGPRFLFTVVPALVVLTARGWAALIERLTPATPKDGRRMRDLLRRAVVVALPLCLLGAWTAPARFAVLWRLVYYHRQRTPMELDVGAVARRSGLTNALVFVHDGWSNRLEARLWALGIDRSAAYQILSYADACALELAIAREEATASGAGAERARRIAIATWAPDGAPLRAGLTQDDRLRLRDPSSLDPGCRAELAADRAAGRTLYLPFLPANRIDAAGRVSGDVIFVRDFGDRNERLRSRFGGRAWYRYVDRSFDGSAPEIRPYDLRSPAEARGSQPSAAVDPTPIVPR
jgi:hypothetical protein